MGSQVEQVQIVLHRIAVTQPIPQTDDPWRGERQVLRTPSLWGLGSAGGAATESSVCSLDWFSSGTGDLPASHLFPHSNFKGQKIGHQLLGGSWGEGGDTCQRAGHVFARQGWGGRG